MRGVRDVNVICISGYFPESCDRKLISFSRTFCVFCSVQSEEYFWNRYQQQSIEDLEDLIRKEKQQQESLANQNILFDAKRENVHLQREAEYRRRLHTVFQEVKRKLDYQIAAQEAVKQFSQRHMVSWILDNVTKNLSSVSEKETLSKCVSDLKALSVARAGVI